MEVGRQAASQPGKSSVCPPAPPRPPSQRTGGEGKRGENSVSSREGNDWTEWGEEREGRRKEGTTGEEKDDIRLEGGRRKERGGAGACGGMSHVSSETAEAAAIGEKSLSVRLSKARRVGRLPILVPSSLAADL